MPLKRSIENIYLCINHTRKPYQGFKNDRKRKSLRKVFTYKLLIWFQCSQTSSVRLRYQSSWLTLADKANYCISQSVKQLSIIINYSFQMSAKCTKFSLEVQGTFIVIL